MSTATITEAPELLKTPAAASFIGVTTSTLNTWRSEKRGPAFIKCGRLVLYRPADLMAWLESRVKPTAESEPAEID